MVENYRLAWIFAGVAGTLAIAIAILVISANQSPTVSPLSITQDLWTCDFVSSEGLLFKSNHSYQVVISPETATLILNSQDKQQTIPLFAKKDIYQSFAEAEPPANQEWYEVKRDFSQQQLQVSKHKSVEVRQESNYAGSSFSTKNLNLGTIGICQN